MIPVLSSQEIAAHGLTPTSLDPPPPVAAIVLQAYHDQYRALDFGIFSECRLVLDGRNALSPVVRRYDEHEISESAGRRLTEPPAT